MIQIVFTDNGKVHTVTFSGDERVYWANRFMEKLDKHNGVSYELKELAVI